MRLALSACLAALLAVAGAGAAVQIVDDSPGAGFRLSGTLTAPRAALAKGSIRLVFEQRDARNYSYLNLAGEQARFHRVVNGVDTPVGVGGPIYRGQAGDQLPFALHRLDWQTTFLCNHVVSARAEDAGPAGGGAGYEVNGAGLSVTAPEAQPTEDIFLADDFMRAGEETGGWTTVTGKWENNQQGSKSSRSANAFSYRSVGDAPALTVVGYPFWSDYSTQVAVRCDGSGAVGLAAGFADEKNYVRLRWTSARQPDGGTCRLQRVLDGQVTDLTPPLPGGFREKVWYKLQLAVAGGKVLGWIDDVPLFEVAEPTGGEGKVGLWTEPGEEHDPLGGALFDDLVVRSWPYFGEDFVVPSQGRWEAVGAPWQLGTGGFGAAPADGLLLAGPADWSEVCFEADAQAERGAVGVVVHRTAQGGYYALRAGRDEVALVKVAGGKATVLDRAAPGVAPGKPHRLALEWEDGLLRGRVDGQERLESFDLEFPAGRCGLLAEGSAGARFTTIRARFRPTFYNPPPTVPEEFAKDPYMTEWASPGAAWVKVDNSPVRWHKGFFYGDRKIRFTVPGFGTQAGQAQIILGAPDTTTQDAWRLVVGLATAEPKLTLRLLHGEQVLGEAKPAVQSDQPAVVFELRGRFLLVWVDDQCVLSCKVTGDNP
ncbi:MAG: hypothetical protein HYU66_21140 [Armatimonadetes bacterium]|nr:hypothetical protein [Armatimonadota bacterium]